MTDTPIDHLAHADRRLNIPSAELEPVLPVADKAPIRVAFERRNRDLDPQLVWRGKDPDQEAFSVEAPPLYLQEHVHSKAIIEDLRASRAKATGGPDLFAHFGLDQEDREAEVEFYKHSKRWSNRMILGDSLAVMASLAEREAMRGQVQCIYIDPPYGIRFNSNFQWSTTSRDVKDGDLKHLTREPEQVKAFRDTWRDGIHSYLAYLRDRLVVARELLTESGSCFVQIGDENVHRVRAVMDEVFGDDNFVSLITIKKTGGQTTSALAAVTDYVVFYARDKGKLKFRQPFAELVPGEGETTGERYDQVLLSDGKIRRAEESDFKNRANRFFQYVSTSSNRPAREHERHEISFEGRSFLPPPGRTWTATPKGLNNLIRAGRIYAGGNTLRHRRYLDDFAATTIGNVWADVAGATDKIYVVQTARAVIQRCLLMTTDPGDLVLDPTCGSGTTATVAEQWGRRWITVDTSRVALALARARIMGARYPYYLLADSFEGTCKAMELEGVVPTLPPPETFQRDLRQGFVYERVPHITLKSIANNAEIDAIWERMQPAVEEALADLNSAMSRFRCLHPIAAGARAGRFLDFQSFEEETLPSGEACLSGEFLEWEVPREAESPMSKEMVADWEEALEILRKIKAPVPARLRTDYDKSSYLNGLRDDLEDCFERLNEGINGPGYLDIDPWDRSLLSAGSLPDRPVVPWSPSAAKALERFWKARIARQREIDASIAARADYETLYDRPYEDRKRLRVAGPFTVESLSPHRAPAVDEHGELIADLDAVTGAPVRGTSEAETYQEAILENLRRAGVHQKDKGDRIAFTGIEPWPGSWIAAVGRYMEREAERRAAILIGSEYGTVARPDLVAASREAADAGMDVLIACAFNFDAMASEFDKLGAVRILRARMNPDLHMADLKAGGGNLFTVFGDPDIKVVRDSDMVRVELRGLDIFKPATGDVVTSEPDEIACWFIDTDYNEEAFFVRHAYFPGAELPYKSLRASLKAEVDEEAWESLRRTVSRPFPRPKSGRIAVKVINHLGDEVMKVMGV